MHRRLRLALVGQATFFETCLPPASRTLVAELPRVPPRRATPTRWCATLRAVRPDVVVRLPARADPAGRAARARRADARLPHRAAAARGRGRAARGPRRGACGSSSTSTRTNFDRIVAFDPLIAPAASGSLDGLALDPAARRRPLLPRRCAPLRGKPRLLFVGRSTPHRERVLMDVKHHHDLLHLAFGVGRERARAGARRARRRHQRPQRGLPELREPRLPAPRRRPPRAERVAVAAARPRARASTTSRSPGPGRSTTPPRCSAASRALWHRVRVRGRLQGRAVPRLAGLAAAAARRDRRRRRIRIGPSIACPPYGDHRVQAP